jgi:malic enzyme
LEKEKEEVCKTFNESIKLHHNELDCLRKSKEEFKRLYEAEKNAREDLEKKLRDCEERKRINQEQVSAHAQQAQQGPLVWTPGTGKPCDQYRFDVQKLE